MGRAARWGPQPDAPLLPRSERQLPVPQPQGGGVEQPGPQQLRRRRRPARGQRAGEGSPGAGRQVRPGEERAAGGGAGGSPVRGSRGRKEARPSRAQFGLNPCRAGTWERPGL